LPIRGYGVLLLTAVASAVALSVRRGRQAGQDPEMILSLGTWLFVCGIGGARVFYILHFWSQFQRPSIGETIKSMLNVAQGGLVVYGSLLAGGLALFVFVRKYRLPGLAMADVVVPGVVLGMAIGRLGCFMNGCCYGGQCDLPWAVAFPWGSPPFVDQVRAGKLALDGLRFDGPGEGPATLAGVEPGSIAESHGLRAGDRIVEVNRVPTPTLDDALASLLRVRRPGDPVWLRVADKPQLFSWSAGELPQHSLPVHPSQLYSAFDAFLLCSFLLAYSPFRRRDGELLTLLMTIHPVSRFLLEMTRNDEGAVFWGLTVSQLISLGLLLSAAALWTYLLSRPAKLTWPASSPAS
jgi:phosphatidylglycerol:prolipoprotein diacylglycerol transferase